MTAQVADRFIYLGSPFHLAAYSNGELFYPDQHGYRPFPASTACWRGYCCEYAVKNGRLVLHQLCINHDGGEAEQTAQTSPPALNSKPAALSTETHIGKWLFDDVSLPLDYSGGVVIGRDFIYSLYAHMGFHPAWKYETVYELIFESGNLVHTSDLSHRMAEAREKIAKNPAEDIGDYSNEQIEQWIKNCFRRDYMR
ncbi:MAG TPA: hypothetical protein VLF09_17375 [Cellvibrio sp.]|nr:hypothetical protein [Cellvibrio sp.]